MYRVASYPKQLYSTYMYALCRNTFRWFIPLHWFHAPLASIHFINCLCACVCNSFFIVLVPVCLYQCFIFAYAMSTSVFFLLYYHGLFVSLKTYFYNVCLGIHLDNLKSFPTFKFSVYIPTTHNSLILLKDIQNWLIRYCMCRINKLHALT